MIKLSNSYLLGVVTILLILLAVAKIIALGLWWYLPSEGVELNVKENYQPKYQRIDCKNMLNSVSVKSNVVAKTDTSTSIGITNMLLKGLYGNSNKGYVIVALKSNVKKTSIVGIGEVFSGYTLKHIMIDSAMFERASKEYVLRLEKPKKQTSSISRVVKEVQSGEMTAVSRNDISYYSKNPKEIWKDISIREVKKGNKITGFKINMVKKGSKFEALGLKRNDILLRANNIELKSYRDALELYKNIDKINTMQIVILRNNQEMELVYEIN